MIELERGVTSKYFFTRLDARYLVQVVHVSIVCLGLGWRGTWYKLCKLWWPGASTPTRHQTPSRRRADYSVQNQCKICAKSVQQQWTTVRPWLEPFMLPKLFWSGFNNDNNWVEATEQQRRQQELQEDLRRLDVSGTLIISRAEKDPSVFTITEKAHTRAFSPG